MTKDTEKTTSLRLPNDVKEFMIERFGSLRGACVALVQLQKIVDENTTGKPKKRKIDRKIS